MKKYLFSLFFGLMALAADAQQYGVTPIPHCWLTGAGIDSTIYGVYLDAAGTTKPSRLHYFSVNTTTFAINAVTVTGGTLTMGACDDYGNCQVKNEYREETLTSTQTYATNTLHSIAIEAVSGTVTVSTDAAPAVTLAIGDVHMASAQQCKYIQSSIAITITGGSAIITRIF